MLFLPHSAEKNPQIRAGSDIFSLATNLGLDKVESGRTRLAHPRSPTARPRRSCLHTNPPSEEVDELLLNARLRDELEPFLDESVHILDCRRLPTSDENEFLAQMLAWERAPVLPIAKWFQPDWRCRRPIS